MRIQSRLRRKLTTAGSVRPVAGRTRARWEISIIAASVRVHQRRLGRLDVEEALEHLQGGRGGGARAVPAVLDQCADHDARGLGRAPSTPPRLVLEVPGRV